MSSQIQIIAISMGIILVVVALWLLVVLRVFKFFRNQCNANETSKPSTALERREALWKARNTGLKTMTRIWTGAVASAGVLSLLSVLKDSEPANDPVLGFIMSGVFFILAGLGYLVIKKLPYYPSKLRIEIELMKTKEPAPTQGE